jgi:broad specificity phosphatase PhoE
MFVALSVASVLSRAVSLISELNRSNIGDCFVLVSHGDTLQILQV